MLRTQAPSDDNGRNRLQGTPTHDLWDADLRQVAGQIGRDDLVLREHLESLDESGG